MCGRPTFESAVATEGLTRALRHSKLTSHFQKLPPKLVDIDAHHGAACKSEVMARIFIIMARIFIIIARIFIIMARIFVIHNHQVLAEEEGSTGPRTQEAREKISGAPDN